MNLSKAYNELGDDRQEHISTSTIAFGHSIAQEPQKLDVDSYRFYRHTNERHQILIFLSGECKMTTDEYEHILQPGDVCFNPALTYYGVTILGDVPYERVVITVEPSKRFNKFAFEVFDDMKPINLDVKECLLPFINRYKTYGTALPIKEFSSLAYNLIEELLYICMIKKVGSNHTDDSAENLLKSALIYIDAHWTSIGNVREISNALFISPSYLYEIFNKKLNMAPKTYLLQKRLRAAHAYLTSGIAPNEVSRMVGFNTYTAFYRACKAFYGKTPQEIWVKP